MFKELLILYGYIRFLEIVKNLQVRRGLENPNQVSGLLPLWWGFQILYFLRRCSEKHKRGLRPVSYQFTVAVDWEIGVAFFRTVHVAWINAVPQVIATCTAYAVELCYADVVCKICIPQ